MHGIRKKLYEVNIMKHKIVIIGIIVTCLIVPIFSQATNNEVIERLDKLEEENQKLQAELDQLKRNTGDENRVEFLQKDQWGREFAFESSGGIQGSFAESQISVIFPRIANTFSIGMGFIYSGNLIPHYTLGEEGIEQVTPYMLSGALVLIHSSPLLFNFMRIYGRYEVRSGYFFNSDAFNGGMWSIGGTGYGGIAFYTSRWTAFYIELGGGGMYKHDAGIHTNKLLTSRYSGYGFGIRAGIRVFLAPLNK